MADEILKKIEHGLIVSCQAYKGEPLFGKGIMVKMAQAAILGGANAIRANGISDIKDMKKELDVPIIGIIKDHIDGFPVYITPTFSHVRAVLEAGADIVALDCTQRKRPEPLEKVFEMTRRMFPDALIMADIATIEDAKMIVELKPDFLATTLSGYTEETSNNDKPDIELVRELSSLFNIPIIAEGNYWEPSQVVQAFQAGAYAVTIGSAITRPQLLTMKFSKAIKIWKTSTNHNSEGKQ